jgi:hypothetical protein
MKKILFLAVICLLCLDFVNGQAPTRIPEGEVFYIQSAYSYNRGEKGYWDIAGVNDVAKGKELKIWHMDSGRDREFTFHKSPQEGYFELQIGNWDSRVDVKGAKNDNGTPIQVWDPNGNSNQRFLFHHLGEGRFKIYTTSGKVISLKNKNDNNGNELHIWNDHDAINVEWYLIRKSDKKAFVPSDRDIIKTNVVGDVMRENTNFFIQSALSYGRSDRGYWDLPGVANNVSNANTYKNGNSLQIWTKDEGVDRFFCFVKAGDTEYYNIKANSDSNFSVDLKSGNTTNGSDIHIWTTNFANPNQQFYFKHLGGGKYKIYHRSGKVLVTQGGGSDANGTNIHIWDDHDKVGTEWYIFTPDGKLYIPETSAPTRSRN